MTLLEIVHTISPDKARIIDDILSFHPEPAKSLGLGDGRYSREEPEGWNKNKLLALSISDLDKLHKHLILGNYRKWSTGHSDFTGQFIDI